MKTQTIELMQQAGLTALDITNLEKLGYFASPFESSGKLAARGGLYQYSYVVTEMMIKLNDFLALGLERKDVIMAGLFHELARCGYYTENILKTGKQSEAKPYTWDPKFVMSKGADSIYLLNNDLNIKVSVQVASAITFRTMQRDPMFEMYILDRLKNTSTDILLCWLLNTAINYTLWIKTGEL